MAPDENPLLEIGRITKPHGLRGEVLVHLSTTESSRVAPGSVLRARDGDLVIASSTPHGARWIVQFDGVGSREAAQELSGTVLRARAMAVSDDGEQDVLWVHELIGADVVDLGGRHRGRVVAVIANPASDLLELDSGGLVPLRFVVGGLAPGVSGPTLRIDPPEGLLPG